MPKKYSIFTFSLHTRQSMMRS